MGKTVTEIRLAAAVVVHEHRVLVVRRSKKERFLPQVWGLPCGKIDAGESSADAALRELREETGLTGHVIRFVGYLTFSSIFAGEVAENVQFNYLIQPRRPLGAWPKVTLPEKDQDFCWIDTGTVEDWMPTGEFEPAGLDEHNVEAIRQAVPPPSRSPSASRTASSRSR